MFWWALSGCLSSQKGFKKAHEGLSQWLFNGFSNYFKAKMPLTSCEGFSGSPRKRILRNLITCTPLTICHVFFSWSKNSSTYILYNTKQTHALHGFNFNAFRFVKHQTMMRGLLQDSQCLNLYLAVVLSQPNSCRNFASQFSVELTWL